ncbi:hypothetical protein HK101_006382, partial [Irineochytrium annulatum]
MSRRDSLSLAHSPTGSQRSTRSLDAYPRPPLLRPAPTNPPTAALTDDPYAPDEDGTRPRVVAVKHPSSSSKAKSKYLVYWCRPSDRTDIFQIGREAGAGVDMVVPGASYIHPAAATGGKPHAQQHLLPLHGEQEVASSTQSRFPFRLVCDRAHGGGDGVRLFSGGFDAHGRLVLGEGCGDLRFVDDEGFVDALVANSVL